MATLQQVVAADSITSNTGPIRIPSVQIPASLGNLVVKLRQQTTVSDVVNKVIGDGHALKENNHTIEDKIKGNTYTYFIEALNGNYEGEQKTGKYEESDAYISLKGNLKKHISFRENTIRADETVCDILKNGCKLPFLYTSLNAEFKNNSSVLKNSEFVEDSIKEMLRAGFVKECLTKPKVLNRLSVSTKDKKRLILDLRYVNNHLFKDKIKFDDWNSFHNYLEGNKGYLFKFDPKSEYHHVDIFDKHQIYLGFSWEINQQMHYFVFTVFPFGLSTAPLCLPKWSDY